MGDDEDQRKERRRRKNVGRTDHGALIGVDLAQLAPLKLVVPRLNTRKTSPATESPIMHCPRHTGSIPSKAYVLSIAALPSCYAAAASSPADTIHLYAKPDLRHLTTLGGHPGGTTSIRSINLHATSNGSSPTLASCGKDGYTRIWDLRSNSPSIESAFPKHAAARLFFLSFFILSWLISSNRV